MRSICKVFIRLLFVVQCVAFQRNGITYRHQLSTVRLSEQLHHSVDLHASKDYNFDANLMLPTKKNSGLLKNVFTGFLAFLIMASSSLPASAISGGGLDFAGLDLSGKDYSSANYKGKDFSQVIARQTTFKGSNLQGCRFYKALLVETDFSDADIRGASLEDTSMDDAILKNTNAGGAYFSASLLDAKTLEGADMTDAQLPPKLLARICEKPDFAKGTNPVTGVDTRDSLMCPE
uniref:Pentapeptide repeat-containing protein n=1 Tax=Proboscia inermis TaxID=420281 RepID=A0A7S0C287_9STRA|mmetsp:Transcript_20466/g.20749  ORF Transcript_20466/g.20749 Transcript_20466/m.20749 type:complete len:234 (+) Transcript_20466:147-848(+)